MLLSTEGFAPPKFTHLTNISILFQNHGLTKLPQKPKKNIISFSNLTHRKCHIDIYTYFQRIFERTLWKESSLFPPSSITSSTHPSSNLSPPLWSLCGTGLSLHWCLWVAQAPDTKTDRTTGRVWFFKLLQSRWFGDFLKILHLQKHERNLFKGSHSNKLLREARNNNPLTTT